MISLDELGTESEQPLCLDFANTLYYRGADAPVEKLPTSSALNGWLMARGLPGSRIDAKDLRRALELREAIYATFAGLAAGAPVPEANVRPLEQEAAKAVGALRLVKEDRVFHWRLSSEAFERAMNLIALSGADLLASAQQSRVHVCADKKCAWLFLDRSKNRSKKWCDMAECGNLAKARRYQERKRQAKS